MNLNLHKVLYLYKTPSKFYIQPVELPNEALIIDRQTCEISLNKMFSLGLLPANATSCLIYGIIGIKHLISCSYLIVITKASQIGCMIDERPIYRMDQAQVIPFNQEDQPPHLGEGEKVDWNSTYVSMLESVLQIPNFYFSHSYDLTNTLQRYYQIQENIMSNFDKIHQSYDKRFLWNQHLMSDFDRCGDIANRYRLPFILGFISINKVELDHNNQSISWILISRRSVNRAGTRFISRGVDHDGNVSNFVETEQIVEKLGTIRTSFVQIRGSVPLIWTQRAGYKYMPTIEVNTDYDQNLPMRKHFDDLRNHYSNVSVVNLVDHKGHEGNLERVFNQCLSNLQKYYHIPYHYFDFHKECSKMRWDRLSILMERLQQEIDSYSYFSINGNQVMQMQNGVIRSNCVDSLDRTNVVQSMIAQRVLETQLNQFKIIPPYTRLVDHENFINIFKNTWADNADALSTQYAGTPALKTDFTRTGQRTSAGLIKDGVSAVTRYFVNNFFDNYRQDAIDLFLGHYEGYPSPLYRPMDLTNYTSTFPVTIVMLTLVVLYIYLRY